MEMRDIQLLPSILLLRYNAGFFVNCFSKQAALQHVRDLVARQVPAHVKHELCLFSMLCVYCEADITRPWCGDLVASDASWVFGFAVSVATVGEKRAQEDGRHAGCAAALVRLPGDQSLDTSRKGCVLRLKVSRQDFRTVVSHRASYKAHSGALEAAGVTMMLWWVMHAKR